MLLHELFKIGQYTGLKDWELPDFLFLQQKMDIVLHKYTFDDH